MEVSPTDDPARIARIVHAAILVGILLIYGVVMYQTREAIPVESTTRHALRIGGYVAIGVAYIVGKVLRDRIMAANREVPAAEWWRANLAIAIALWAALETAGLVPIVLGYLAVDRVLATIGTAAALILLFVTRPSSLAAGRA